MPLFIPPIVRTVDQRKNYHAISFAYLFTGDKIQQVSFGNGLVTSGTSYTLNTNGLSSVSLPRMRSMKFSASFFPAATAAQNDGSLYVWCTGSGELTRISNPLIAPGEYTSAPPTVTGVIPIVSLADASIIFVKQAPLGGVLPPWGLLTATLYDFDVAPFIQQGYAISGE